MSALIWRYRWRILSAWIAAFSFATGWSIRDAREQSHRGAIALSALCAFKVDLKGRVTQGEAFLEAHPDGAFGFSAPAIRTSITNERATVRSLAILHCKETP